MKKEHLKDKRTVYRFNEKTRQVEACTLMKFSFYPSGWGYLKVSDSNLYAVTKKDLEEFYLTREEAERSEYNLFTVGNGNYRQR